MKKLWIILLVGLLGACSQFAPFEDRQREAGEIQPRGRSSDDFPAICYNPIWHDENQVKELAEQACTRTNRHATLDDTKAFACRLVNPSIAIYKCE